MERFGNPGETPPKTFNPIEYLRYREQREQFVMVELGHGLKPAAFAENASFTGGRAYIGIEAWQRKVLSIRQDFFERRGIEIVRQNIFFIDRSHVQTEKNGFLDTGAILPAGAADELLLANILGDPQCCTGIDTLRAILEECRRLLTESGRLVVRETLSPPNENILKQYMEASGLQPDAIVRREEQSVWEPLEITYGSGGFRIGESPLSYYVFASIK